MIGHLATAVWVINTFVVAPVCLLALAIAQVPA